MSRSFKKTPITGYSLAESEKRDKKIWHGRARAIERDRLKYSVLSEEDHLSTADKEAGSVWDMAKDGKQYLHNDRTKYMRK